MQYEEISVKPNQIIQPYPREHKSSLFSCDLIYKIGMSHPPRRVPEGPVNTQN